MKIMQRRRELEAANSMAIKATDLMIENEKLKQAIAHISYCHNINTGNEPSLSCFNRALDEALELVKA
jgi:hypothetical protein